MRVGEICEVEISANYATAGGESFLSKPPEGPLEFTIELVEAEKMPHTFVEYLEFATLQKTKGNELTKSGGYPAALELVNFINFLVFILYFNFFFL
jgi:hypothetical protein